MRLLEVLGVFACLISGCSFVFDEGAFPGLHGATVSLVALDPVTGDALAPGQDIRTVHPLRAQPDARDGRGDPIASFDFIWESWSVSPDETCETEPDAADVVTLKDVGAEVAATHTRKHQCWRVRAHATRGDRVGAEALSNVVRVVNSPPTIRSIALSAYQPMVDDFLRAYPTGVEDVDNDVVATAITWSFDGSPPGPRSPVSVPEGTVKIRAFATVTDNEGATAEVTVAARPITRAPTWYPLAPSADYTAFSFPDENHNRVVTKDSQGIVWEYRLDEPRGWTPLGRAPDELRGAVLATWQDRHLHLVRGAIFFGDQEQPGFWLFDTSIRGEETWCKVVLPPDEEGVAVTPLNLHEGLLLGLVRDAETFEVVGFVVSRALQAGCPTDRATIEVAFEHAPVHPTDIIAKGVYWANVPGRAEAYLLGGVGDEDIALKVEFNNAESGQVVALTDVILGHALPTVGAGVAFDSARNRFVVIGGGFADNIQQVLFPEIAERSRGVFEIAFDEGVEARSIGSLPPDMSPSPVASLGTMGASDDFVLTTNGDDNAAILRVDATGAVHLLEQRAITAPRAIAFAGEVTSVARTAIFGGLPSTGWQSWSFDSTDNAWRPVDAQGPSFRVGFGTLGRTLRRRAFFGGLLDLDRPLYDETPAVRGPYAPAELWELLTVETDDYAWRRYSFADGHEIGSRAGHVVIDALGGPGFLFDTPRFLIAGGHRADGGPSTTSTLITCPSVDGCVTEPMPEFPPGAYARVVYSEHASRYIAIGGSDVPENTIYYTHRWQPDLPPDPWTWTAHTPLSDPTHGAPPPQKSTVAAVWPATACCDEDNVCDFRGDPDRIFIAGGLRTDASIGSQSLRSRPTDLWVLEIGEAGLADSAWTKIAPTTPFGEPPARFGHTSNWSGTNKELSVFGGLTGNAFGDPRWEARTDSWVVRGLDTLNPLGACP